MSLDTEKIELVEAIINLEDIALINELKAILDKGKAQQHLLSAAQINKLEIRRSNHQSKQSKSYSWSEAKKLVKTL